MTENKTVAVQDAQNAPPRENKMGIMPVNKLLLSMSLPE